MGRHSSGRSGPFFRSLIGWFFPWLLIAAVVGAGTWMVLDYRNRTGGPDVASASTESDTSSQAGSTASAEPEPEETISPTEAEPSATPDEREERKRKRDSSVRLITEGVSVQVLNGTSDVAAGEAMAEKLSGLGYQVVTVESTSTPYKETTVFWSFPDASDAGRALAARFGWESGPKPGNLADTVSLHVVVGRDF